MGVGYLQVIGDPIPHGYPDLRTRPRSQHDPMNPNMML